MSVKKQYLKSEPVCKVTFRIEKEIGKPFQSASVVGDFNGWSAEAHPMSKLKKDGSFSLVAEIPTGSVYQFRYVLDGNTWVNDNEADGFVSSPYADSQNGLLDLTK
ncbi:MAG: 1,4-alpha-glucan-branching protein [Ignavibacteriaceae bacterium]|nr:MAG: glycoside hydrolase [Chlorobiota bacterium]GJQ32955.1 MAG: 1,4-alpha-glucan-branching protein [Ignavibacteriaceae bacterium]